MADRLFEVIKDILTISGGMVGAPAGPLGALGGAGIARAGGEGIHNLYRQQSGQPVSQAELLKSALEGATMEAGGQIIGKTIGAGLDKLKPDMPTAPTVDIPPVSQTLEFHASPGAQIPNPRPWFTQNTSHGKAFHTTPAQDVAEAVGYGKTHKAILKGQMPPDTKPEISAYYPRMLNPEEAVNIKSIEDIHALAQKIGMTPDDIAYIDNKYIEYLKRGVEPQFALDRTYTDLAREASILNSAVEPYSKGVVPTQIWGDLLKQKGIRKVEKPLAGMLSPQDREVIYFYPQEDLVYKKIYDLLSKQNSIILNNRAQASAKRAQIDDVKKLQEVLAKALSVQADEQ